MKNNKIFRIGLVIIVIVGALFYWFITSNQKVIMGKDFIYLDFLNYEFNYSGDYVFTDYEDYYSALKSNVLSKNDFQNNNYLLFRTINDHCGVDVMEPTDYIINGNNIDIIIKYEGSCGVCAGSYKYYLLKLDKSIINVNVNLKYELINDYECDLNVAYKPLIYLYPEKTMDVIVKLGYPDRLTATYPKYNDEWSVVAKSNGDLIDKSGRTYYGLYWEGINYIKDNYNDGFVVSKEDTSKFLEEKLSILGLTEREANEFIIYWLPKLEENKYNLIRFENINIINEQMPLDINPRPDTIIRILMEYKPLDNIENIEEQKLTSPTRKGFTVVEWGGSLIK